MQSALSNKNETLLSRICIMVIATVSLILRIAAFFPYYFIYEIKITHNNGTVYKSDDTYTYEKVFDLPRDEIMFKIILTLIVYLLFFLYVSWLYKKRKSQLLMPTILGLGIFCRYLFNGGPLFLTYNWRMHGFGLVWLLVCCALGSLFFIVFHRKKWLFAIAVAGTIVLDVIDLKMAYDIQYLDKYRLFLISILLLDIAILLFGILKDAPTAQNKTIGIGYIGKANPQKALKLLKEDFELGIITEEEYNEKRKEIIAKI